MVMTVTLVVIVKSGDYGGNFGGGDVWEQDFTT